ncbi:MAG: tetratricopeptide repeat protein, partial [bacterium]
WPALVACLVAFAAITFPMLGLVQNGPQIAADRYTYHSAPAIAVLVASGYMTLRRRLGPPATGLAAALCVTLGALTWSQCGVWRDSESLWTRVVALDDGSSIGHVGLANVLYAQNRNDEGLAQSLRAAEIAPLYAQTQNDVGVGLAHAGRMEDAVRYYQRSLELEPTFEEAHANWGVVLAQQGNLAQAIEHYRTALSINADNAVAHIDWGNALVRQGATADAITHYQEALRIRPDQADAEHNWGVALARQGQLSEAIVHFRRALAIKPDHAEARDYLDKALDLQRVRP